MPAGWVLGSPRGAGGLQPELLCPSGLGPSPCVAVQGCWGLSQGGLSRGWGTPWDSCREGVLYPLLLPQLVPLSFPQGQDEARPAPTEIPPGRGSGPHVHIAQHSHCREGIK